MNSLKKIALAVVAAMTMSTLVATSANAATALTVGGSSASGGTTSATAIELPVPADNSVDSADALKFAFTSLETGTIVAASATNAKIVTALATSSAPVTSSAGTSSVSINTGTGTTAEFFVFTTTTTVGTVSVTIAGNTTVYYVKGIAGALNTISVSAPATAAAGSVQTITVAGYDVFGNAKGGASVSLQYITPTASTTYTLTTDTAVATLGTKTQDVTFPASGTVTLVGTATVASAVTGLATPLGVIVKTSVVRDLASELAAVQAQLAAEKAGRASDKVSFDLAIAAEKLAAAKAASDAQAALLKANSDNAAALKAVKDAFNALAKKWNAKNPKAKVTLLN